MAAAHTICASWGWVCFGDAHPWIGSTLGAAATVLLAVGGAIIAGGRQAREAHRNRRMMLKSLIGHARAAVAIIEGHLDLSDPGPVLIWTEEEAARLREAADGLAFLTASLTEMNVGIDDRLVFARLESGRLIRGATQKLERLSKTDGPPDFWPLSADLAALRILIDDLGHQLGPWERLKTSRLRIRGDGA